MAIYNTAYGTMSEFNALKNAGKVENNKMYIVTDTKQIYVGEDLYTGQVSFVSAFPANPSQGVIYVSNENGEVKSFDGTDFKTIVPALATSLTTETADGNIVSAKAIRDYVATNYATKDEVSSIPKFAVEVVDELPETGKDATIYLVKSGTKSKNLYDEYIYTNGEFELLGTQPLDISGKQDALTAEQLAAIAAVANKANADDVYTKIEVDGLLADKADSADVYTKTEVDTELDKKANAADVYTKSQVDELVTWVTMESLLDDGDNWGHGNRG